MADEDGDLLVILLDTHLFYAPGNNAEHKDGVQTLQPSTLLEQVLYFVGAYRLLHDNNQLAVFAVQEHACQPLYMLLGDENPSSNNPYKSIKEGLIELLKQHGAGPAKPRGPAALSGALSRALCLIHRLQASPGRARMRSKPRILCLMGSQDVPMQYIPIMNSIFSAQRAEVAIDALVLHTADSAFLQQATHLTGGLYFRPSSRASALQHLVQSLSADTHTRSMLSAHQPLGVDFRASCFCHKRIIDIGFVCSVCLSIFCRQAPSCFICGTAFALQKRKVGGQQADEQPSAQTAASTN